MLCPRYCLALIVCRIICVNSVENRMYLPLQALFVILLVGLVAGWIVAKVVTKRRMEIAGDAFVGVIRRFYRALAAASAGRSFWDRLRVRQF